MRRRSAEGPFARRLRSTGRGSSDTAHAPSAVHTFASRRGAVGNLVEEPFTAVVGSTDAPVYLLPITEICRTIRRDVRATAQYSQLGGNYSVPYTPPSGSV